MKLAFLSCDRTPRYIERSLESARKNNLSVTVYHNGLNPPSGDWFSLVLTNKYGPGLSQFRASKSFCDILGNNFDEDLLICEDDVIFTRGFERKLSERLVRIPSKDFILALYSTDNPHDQYVEHINPKHWHGSLGMYIPARQRKPLHDHFQEALKFGTGIDYAADLAIANYCRVKCVALYISNPSLVQHIGKVSSVLNYDTGNDHFSPSFKLY